MKSKLCQELVALMDSDSGLHFNASRTSSDYLEGSFMQIAAQKIKHSAPFLWDLVYNLLDANPSYLIFTTLMPSFVSSATFLSPSILSAIMTTVMPLLLNSSGIQNISLVFPDPVGKIVIQFFCSSCADAEWAWKIHGLIPNLSIHENVALRVLELCTSSQI